MRNEADLSLQVEMINADVNHSQGAIHTPGPKDPHHAGGENLHLAPQTGGQD